MSKWNYVIGAIEVDSLCATDEEAMYRVKTTVNHLPKIFGSEGDVEFYFNKVKGHNISSNVDELDVFSNLGEPRIHNFIFETQSHVLITMNGSLRDTEFEDILKETSTFLTRLSNRLLITKCSVTVSSAYNRRFTFDNNEYLLYKCDDYKWWDKYLQTRFRYVLK